MSNPGKNIMSIKNLLGVALFVATELASTFISRAYAQENEEAQWDIAVGAVALSTSAAWKGGNTQYALLPYLDASKGNWRFNMETPIGYQVELNEILSVSVGLGVRDDGYDSNDLTLNKLSKHQIFDGYEKPDAEVLAKYGVTYGWLALEASRDVSNNSKSNAVSLSLEVPVYRHDNGFSLSTAVSAHWHDSDYVNYYYGVAGSNIDNSVGRVAYESNAATNYDLRINAMYEISDNWVAMGSVSRTILDNNIANSPLISSDHQDTAVLMLAYKF